MNHAAIIHVAKWRTHFANCINYRTHILKKCFRFLSFSANLLLLLCSQNNLTDGKEDQPEDTFSLLSVLLVGSLNFPFDRSRLAPRRQPSRRTFARKLWSKLSIYLSLSFSLCFLPYPLLSFLNSSTHNSFFFILVPFAFAIATRSSSSLQIIFHGISTCQPFLLRDTSSYRFISFIFLQKLESFF